MNRNLLLIVFFVAIVSCSRKAQVSNEKAVEECTEELAKERCFNFLKKHRLLGYETKTLILDTLLTYKILVSPKSETMLGGGGEFEISRQTCKILNVQLHQ